MSNDKKCGCTNHRVDNLIDPYVSLANAIVLQGINDYRSACKREAECPKSPVAKHTQRECLKFFRSKWFGALTDVRPELLIKRLAEERKFTIMRISLRKLYESVALRRAVQRCDRHGNQ